MGEGTSERRVVMAKLVAARWLEARARPEHRVKVFYGPREIKNASNLLRSFRDGKLKIGSIDPILDLGIREEFDHMVLWSSDKDALMRLAGWFEARGCETSGIW